MSHANTYTITLGQIKRLADFVAAFDTPTCHMPDHARVTICGEAHQMLIQILGADEALVYGNAQAEEVAA